jgi:iron complex transport system substrate-binding protein
MRIVSLLPSATESLFALGLGNSLVAVTHECDYPPQATSLPMVTRSSLHLDGKDGERIEAEVSLAAAEGRSLYFVDTDAIRELNPDLIVAQDVCRVCAVSAEEIVPDLAGFKIIRQHPHSLEDVLRDIETLAAACDTDPRPLIRSLRARIETASQVARRRPPVRAVFLEWIDPPYPAGHWTPDLLALAGIDDPLVRPGMPSVPSSWADVAAAQPQLLVLAPCGFGQDRAEAEARRMRPEIDSVGAARVVVLDGSAYFNRPGPRLVDSLEVLVAAQGQP